MNHVVDRRGGVRPKRHPVAKTPQNSTPAAACPSQQPAQNHPTARNRPTGPELSPATSGTGSVSYQAIVMNTKPSTPTKHAGSPPIRGVIQTATHLARLVSECMSTACRTNAIIATTGWHQHLTSTRFAGSRVCFYMETHNSVNKENVRIHIFLSLAAIRSVLRPQTRLDLRTILRPCTKNACFAHQTLRYCLE